VLIRGEGVAACGCIHLLSRAGISPTIESTPRPKVPAIMLGEATQKLLADVFDRRDLFDGLPRINKRVVAWGKNSSPVALAHSAVVASEEVLLDRIQSVFPHHAHVTGPEPNLRFTPIASIVRGAPFWLSHGDRFSCDAQNRMRLRRMLGGIPRQRMAVSASRRRRGLAAFRGRPD